jgi:cysteine desulfurase
MERIYLDYAATTPVKESVIEAMAEAMRLDFGNPSALYTRGRRARSLVDQARRSLASYLGFDMKGFTFTSGATEANAQILLTNARRLRKEAKGNHLITSLVEHPSVRENFKLLEEEGFEVTYLPVNREGVVEIQALEEALKTPNRFAFRYGLNNETGAIMPLAKMGQILEAYREKQGLDRKIFFHTDAVQAIGKLSPEFFRDIGLDALTGSAHKIFGPKGVGFFYQDPAIKTEPLLRGGHQERSRRAGTENVPGIVGLGQAVRELETMDSHALYSHYMDLEAVLYEALDLAGISYERNGGLSQPERSWPGIQNLYFPDILADRALIKLDLQGIEVSAGSACAAGALEPSPVLSAMFGQETEEARDRLKKSLRISFGPETKKEEMNVLVRALATMVK